MTNIRRATTSAVPSQDSTSPATPPYGFSDEIQPVPQPPPPQLEDFDVAKGDLAPIGDTGNRWVKIKRHLSLFNLTLLT